MSFGQRLLNGCGEEVVNRLRDEPASDRGENYDDEAAHKPATELVEARERISAVVGQPVDRAALPLGQYDRRVLARLRAAGYREVCTSDRRPARSGAWLQPRYSVTDTDTIDSLKTSVLSPRPARERLVREAVGLVKRWR